MPNFLRDRQHGHFLDGNQGLPSKNDSHERLFLCRNFILEKHIVTEADRNDFRPADSLQGGLTLDLGNSAGRLVDGRQGWCHRDHMNQCHECDGAGENVKSHGGPPACLELRV